MPGIFWVIGAATVLFAGVVAYALTRRYNWGVAVMLPLLSLIALIGMRWQRDGLSLAEGAQQLLPTLTFAAPVLLGTLAGIALARPWHG